MAEPNLIDVAAILDRRRIGGFQLRIAMLLLLAMFFDGYDLQALAFAAPSIIKEWHLSKAAFGLAFGLSRMGQLAGAILFSHIGDRHGRKTAIVGGMLLFGVFVLLSTQASGLGELTLLLFVAGMGIGGVNPNCIALNAEYAPERYRATSVAIMFIGYTAGGASGSAVASTLLPSHGWPIVFWVGGLPPLLAAAVLVLALPESLRFLALSPGRRARLAAALRRIEPSLAIDRATRFLYREQNPAGSPVAHLFREGRAPMTLLLWLVFFCNLMTLNFITSWTPTVLHAGAVTASQAALANGLFLVSGGIGGLAFSRIADGFGIRTLALTFGLGAPLVLLIGTPGLSPLLLMMVVFGAGGCVVGSQIPLNAASAMLYPTFIRSTGAGWALVAGRLGSIVGPVFGGLLISAGLATPQLFCVAAVPVGFAALGCFFLSRRPRAAAVGEVALDAARRV